MHVSGHSSPLLFIIAQDFNWGFAKKGWLIGESFTKKANLQKKSKFPPIP